MLRRLDASGYLFQILIDDCGRLIGTITDGDVRRAMLEGVQLDEPSIRCAQTKPLTGRIGDDNSNLQKLLRLGSTRTFLPLLDDAGVVSAILYDNGRSGLGEALIMAGGFGKRLGERTRKTPKPLLDVGGQPILEHVVSALERAGTRTIYVSVHYLSDQIKTFFDRRSNLAKIDFIEEETPLGTAGAIGFLPEGQHDPVLVVNGDLITKVDYRALHEFYSRRQFDAVVCVARYNIQVPYGVIRYDQEGLFSGIEEKPEMSNFIAAGIYYLGPQFISLVRTGERMDMPELLTLGRTIGLKIGLFPIHESWTDVGRPEDLAAADHSAKGQIADSASTSEA